MKSRFFKFTRSATRRPVRHYLPAVLTLLSTVAAAAAQEPAGDVRNVHDPAVAEQAGRFYLFSTRAGVSVRCTEDLVRWRLRRRGRRGGQEEQEQ